MKQLLLITLCLLLGSITFAQQIDLNKQVVIAPSSKLVKLNKNERMTFEKEKFHDNNHESIKELGNLPTFKIDDILITLNSEKGNLKTDHLISMKKGLDGMSRKNPNYHSSIETINERKVLLLSDLSTDNTKSYQFYCVNGANNTVVTGLLRFKPTDDTEAKHVLDDLIKNITFKE